MSARIAPGSSLPTVGRFILTARIGQGGFGEVYAAEDPTLRRTVAVKLLQVNAPAGGVLEEARAMATLSHPNVVAVHDVGEHEGEPYLVMDFVEGATLGQWLRDDRRTWREITRVLVDVARGVTAAHMAGLVHRDLKPGNVLVEAGVDGRAQVTDFGLAAWAGVHEGTAVPGTRGYTAPELMRGDRFLPSADQYSYCVLGLEALQRAERSPPAALVAVLERGLRGDPDSRWPSMRALTKALERVLHRGPRRRRVALSLLGIAGVVGGSAALATRRDPVASCTAAAEAVSEEASAAGPRIVSAFTSAAPEFGASIGERVRRDVEAHADALAQGWSSACQAATATPSGRRARMCFEQRAWELGALVDVFEAADAGVVEHASEAVAVLADAPSCLHPESSQRAPSVDQLIATVEARRTLARALSLQHAGQYPEALAAATEAHRLGQSAGYDPVIARSAFRRGVVLAYLEDYEAAIEQFRASLAAAYAGEDALQVAWAQTLLAQVAGGYLGDASAGDAWLSAARASLGSQGLPAELEDALLSVEAMLAEQRGAYDQATKVGRTLVERATARLPPSDPRIANAFTMLGNLEYRAQQVAAADTSYVEALERRTVVLGPSHPQTGIAHNNVALTAMAKGDHVTARKHLRRAIAVAEASPSGQVALLRAKLNLALIDLQTGDSEAAEHALSVLEAEAEGVSQARLRARIDLLRGDAALERGVLHEASKHYRDAGEGWPSTHPQQVGLAYRRAVVASAAGRFEEAAAEYGRAIRLATSVLGPQSPVILGIRAGAAENAAVAGDDDAARAEVRAVVERSGADFTSLNATSKLELARALLLLGDAQTAQRLAEHATPLVDARDDALHAVLEAELSIARGERIDVEAVRARVGGSHGRHEARLLALDRANR